MLLYVLTSYVNVWNYSAKWLGGYNCVVCLESIFLWHLCMGLGCSNITWSI